MTEVDDIDEAIERVLEATASNFMQLVVLAGLNPATDFRYANLSDINFADCNLRGFDFTGSLFDRAKFAGARIAGAKFSRSAQLYNLLSCAIDAKEVLGKEPWRRSIRRRPRKSLSRRDIAETSKDELAKGEANRNLWLRMPLVPRPSRLGTGAFAVDDLVEGTIVIPRWHDAFYEGMEGWVSLDRSQVRQLPRDAKRLFLRYGLDQDFDKIVGPVDIRYVATPDNFINHSCDPNLGYDVFGNVVAMRTIARGEEVCIDYGCFSVNFSEPFDCACGSGNCRGRVLRQDWKKLAITYGMNMPRFLQGSNPRELPSERNFKRDIMIGTLSEREDVWLRSARGRTLYQDVDDSVRAVCSVSRRRKSRRVQYWYGYSLKGWQFLSQRARAFLVLGCIDRDTAFAIPNHEIAKIIDRLHLTPGRHWHLVLEEDASGKFSLVIPHGARVPLEAFALVREQSPGASQSTDAAIAQSPATAKVSGLSMHRPAAANDNPSNVS